MKNMLPLMVLMSVLAACGPAGTGSAKDSNGISHLALGDSYTIGESVGTNERYPNQLLEALEREGVSTGAVEIVARTGWTTGELQTGIANAGISGNAYDLVSLLIGVNDEFRGRSVEGYRTEFTALLHQAIRFAGGKKEHVFVISIPDYGYTPYGRSRQSEISVRIDAFNAVAKAVADELQVTYIDITAISRNGLFDPELVAFDGLHPSGKMYGQWAALMLKDIKKMLSDG